MSLFLRIRIPDECLPRWTCLDWDDIKNESKKGCALLDWGCMV